MSRLSPVWALLTILLLSTLTLAGGNSGGRKYAVLVGVQEYKHEKLPALQYSENDVVELAKVLRKAGYFVTLLCDSVGKKDAALVPTKTNIERAVKETLRKCDRGDTVIVALAGHGVQFETQKDAFFCPVDARPLATATDSLVSLNRVYDELDGSFASVKVLLVDACRNDPAAERGRRGIDADSAPRPPSGIAALFSCRAGEHAFEHAKYKHGVFFYHLLQGLQGEAKNSKGNVTFAALAEYVQELVSADVPKLIGDGAKQSPNMKADLSGPSLTLIAKTAPSSVGNNYSGIGAQIRKPAGSDSLLVVTPIYGGPAYKAGVRANDLITTIIREVDENGKKLAAPEVLSTKDLTLEDAVGKLLGIGGTTVKLLVQRQGATEPLEFNLRRGKIELESVLGFKRKIDDTCEYVIDPANKIAYVRLTQFTRSTSGQLDKLMQELHKSGVRGFVLDLRFNAGGLLNSALRVADLFIDDGLLVTVRPFIGASLPYMGKSDGSYTSFPMVCLIHDQTVGAGEVVAACLQDHGRSVVAGQRTKGMATVYGEGFVVDPDRLSDKTSTGTCWRPSGRNLERANTKGRDEDEWGVHPDRDHEIKVTGKEQKELEDFLRDQEVIYAPGAARASDKSDFRDRQLEAALEYLRRQIKAASGSK
jgi:carboxyl-terminal processing protease